MTAVAVGAAALAMLLLVRPPARPAASGAAVVERRWVPVAVLVAGVVAALAMPRLGGLALVLSGTATGAAGLWRRRRRRRAAERVAAQVLDTCELLAGELTAGRPPGEALQRAAASWPPLARVAEAFRVGADVPSALRVLAADLEGARDLRVVAAAWQVAHRTGQGLASAVERVAESLRAGAATRRMVTGELGSARATARLVAGLPVLALAMGSGAGGDPWGFLLGHPAGLLCLAGGLAFGLAGLWWIEAIAAAAEESW
ncbi:MULTISPECIES: type II secretion system F family protein [unclassified Nocardioides]|uniref:type II secretion system F family protein n=1 Tax=unclassified Nocardioides TaxID=2615069 RepID=UPI0000EB606C|nr:MULTISPECIES: type II secretion system F family protein [unclassified Nocardioides]ABL79908.1 type II secretion system protein [Nocardioides sp. JS614]